MPSWQPCLSAETYRGVAFVVNDWYLTAYEPILDGDGEIIGALYVGVKQDENDAFSDVILNTTVGSTGYVCVGIGRQGRRPRPIPYFQKWRTGWRKHLGGPGRTNGNYFVQSMVEKALALAPGEVASSATPG